MRDRLRRALLGRPAIVAACVLAAYLLLGFLALPAVLKWQLEKQVQARLEHRLEIGELRWNPLLFTLEARELRLVDPRGRALIGLRRLFLDFELRSIVDLAWNFAEVSIEGLSVDVEVEPDGGHNFQPLLDRLTNATPLEPATQSDPAAPPPRLVVQRAALADARIVYSDRLLPDPLVLRLDSIALGVENLSTLPGERGRYALNARTAAGEALESNGDLGLNPVATEGRFALAGIEVATLARAFSRWVAMDSPGGRIDLSANFKVAARGGAGSGSTLEAAIDALDLGATGLTFAARGGQAPLLKLDALNLKGGRADLDKREIGADSLVVGRGGVTASVDGDGRLDWSSLGRGAQPAASAEPWHIAIGRVEVTEVGVAFSDARSATRIEAAAIALGVAPRVELGGDALRVELDQPSVKLDGVRVHIAEDDTRLDSASVAAQRLALEPKGSAREVVVEAPQATLGRIAAQFGAQRAVADGGEIQADRLVLGLVPDPGSGAPAAELRLGQARLSLASAAYTPDAAREFVRAARLSVGAQNLEFASREGEPDLGAEGLTASIDEAMLRGAGDEGVLLRLGRAEADGGTLRLRERLLKLERAAIANADLKAWLDARGRINWASVFGGRDTGTDEAAQRARPWRIVLDKGAVDGLSAAFEDRRSDPAPALALESVRARIEGFDSEADTPVRVEVAARVGSGGELAASGTVLPDGSGADLAVRLADVALAPAQPLLARYARLALVKGGASLEGRLRYGGGAPDGARLAYRGSFSVRDLLLEELDPKQPFLAWDSVSSDEISLSIGPNRLEAGEVRVDGINGRLIIAEDRRLRLLDLLVRRAQARDLADQRRAGPPSAGKDPSETRDAGDAQGEATAAEPFDVDIARIRFEHGVLDFADLSLRPQFATRMHELQGVIAGLSTDPQRTAKLQFVARVNEYGSAKIDGELSLRRPEELTDVEMVFRNIRIADLSPYVVRFAGYRVVGGTLSVDLQYRIKDRKLLGEHKIVMNRMQLGEKVDSPGALDLPLGLAIALLQDSKGVIDIGLPVSGDLDDPQFSYGGIILKAIGNLIVGIVTAPFRALGALLGAGAQDVDSIEFEPGSAALAPPERGKLVSVAKVLAERPGLKLVVAGVQAPELDGLALRSLAVRTELARLAGVKLEAGEDPGPLDPSDARTQRAIEELFSQRYAPAVLEALKSRAAQAAPGGGLHRSLVDKLVDEQTLPEDALARLASARADAVVRELTSVAGAPPDRVATAASRRLDAVDAKTVTLKLELAAAK